MNTYSAKPVEVRRDWLHVDASGLTLGRLASMIAYRLRGKHKPTYTQHVDVGDYIVVTNADKLAVTGNKTKDKVYYSHSGYPGGIKKRTFEEMQARAPGRALTMAVKRMLPKGPLGRQMLRKLKIYADDKHPHEAQQPIKWENAQDK